MKDGLAECEFEKLVEDVKGHALTLTCSGSLSVRAFHGDIRQRDRVEFRRPTQKCRAATPSGRWRPMCNGSERWQRRRAARIGRLAIAGPVRPARHGGLPRGPAASTRIPGLTEPLVGTGRRRLGIQPDVSARREAADSEPRRGFRRTRLARCASAAARILRPAPARAAARRLARRPPAALRTPLRDHARKETSPRSKTSNRSTKPWPTAARRGCSKRRMTSLLRAHPREGTNTTASGSSAHLVRTWEPSPASSSNRGLAFRPRSRRLDQAWLLRTKPRSTCAHWAG